MFSKATTFLLAALLLAPALGSQTATENPSGAQTFLDAVRLSYDGKHADMERMIVDYDTEHPDDLLGPLRLFEDRFIGVYSSKVDDKVYRELLDMLNDAIAKLELKHCAGTDLQGIGNGTLDCSYVGAALYGDRMALMMKKHRFLKFLAAYKDDCRFNDYAAKSDLPQVRFLRGVNDYEVNVHIGRDPIAPLKEITGSLTDKSPFADDIWFFILGVEEGGGLGAAMLSKQYPHEDIVKRLKAAHPDNKTLFDDKPSKKKTEIEKLQ